MERDGGVEAAMSTAVDRGLVEEGAMNELRRLQWTLALRVVAVIVVIWLFWPILVER